MKAVSMIQTRDGVLHPNPKAAERYAEKAYGEAVDKLAHKIAQLTNYTEISDFINTNLEAFVALKALKDDMRLESTEEEAAQYGEWTDEKTGRKFHWDGEKWADQNGVAR